MDETNDQVQSDSQASSGPEVIRRDQPDQASEGQSETTSEQDVETSKTYKVDFPDGTSKEMSSDELYDHYQKIGPEFTRRSQELAELKRESQEREASAERDATRKIEENELLKNVDPNVKEAIIQMVKPVITETLLEKEREAEQKAANEAFDRKLDKLESDYPGGNGLPKFDRRVVLKAMQDPNNEIYDPEAKFYMMNRATFEDHLIKQALKTKKAGPETETTSSEAPEKPSSPSPKTLSEASKRAYERLRSS